MSGTTHNTPMAPYSGLVMIIGEIIAPMVSALTNLLISAFSKRTPSEKTTPPSTPAPHVSMVLVPGNFMTGPFTYR